MATVDKYLARITSEHNDKPKYMAMVEAIAQCFAEALDVAKSLPAVFDLDDAVGVQLDAVALWIGLSRIVNTPLNVYFSLDTPGLGFDQGSWKGPFDSSQGLTVLDDETFRTMLKIKIAANHWDSTMPSFLAIVARIFAGTGITVFATDNQDMSMSVYLTGTPPPAVLLALIKNGYFLLKPEAVRVNYYKPSVDNAPLFGFDIQNADIAGFNTGVWAVSL